MSHAGSRYQDKQYLENHGHHENHRSDRYKEDRRARKPYPYNARSTEDIRGGQHSRASTALSDPYSKASGAAQEYFGPQPEFYPPKETFSMKCSKRGENYNWEDSLELAGEDIGNVDSSY